MERGLNARRALQPCTLASGRLVHAGVEGQRRVQTFDRWCHKDQHQHEHPSEEQPVTKTPQQSDQPPHWTGKEWKR